MLNLFDNMRQWLLTQATVVGAVGTAAGLGSWVFSRVAPASAGFPRIVVEMPTRKYGRHMTGGDGTANARIVMRAQAQTLLEAETLGDALVDVLHGFRGSMSHIEVVSCFVDVDRDGHRFADEGGDVAIYERSLELNIWHRTDGD